MEQELKIALDAIQDSLKEVKLELGALANKTGATVPDSKAFLDNEFYELNALNTFVKLKANSFGIGKVLFAFVQFDQNTKKLTTSMDVYMDMEEALLLSADILSGRIATLAQNEKAKGAKYPGAIYSSPMGGVNEKKAAERKLRTDGKAISRLFTLSPGSKQPFIFTAEQRPGSSNEKGLIVPEYGAKPEVQIRVPATAESLKKMALSIQSNINAYRAAQYALGAFNVPPKSNN